MSSKLPFYKTIPFRNLILDVSHSPIPQYNNKHWSIDNIRMNDYDLFICAGGKALFDVDGEEYILEKGMALLIAPNQLVNARTLDDKPVLMLAQHFMLYLFNHTDFFSIIRYKSCVTLEKWESLKTIVYEITKFVAAKEEIWTPLDTNPLFMFLLNAFLEEAFIEENFSENHKSSLVLKLINIIESDFRNPDLLEKLMSQSTFGYSHTSNTFKKYTGLPLKTFITERRLTAAKEILMRNGSIRESASAAGYQDEFHFSRIFKKYNGISPRDYRKTHY